MNKTKAPFVPFIKLLLAVMLIVMGMESAKGQRRCSSATGQSSGIDGVCLLCSVNTPTGSIGSDLTKYTSFNITVGLGVSGYQTLIFPSSGLATDSVRIDIATSTGLGNLALLGDITATVLNGSTTVSSYPLNSTLVSLKPVAGNRFTATMPATGVYTSVEIRFKAVVAALSSINIYGADIIYPNPTISTVGQTICSGNPTTLTATANGGTTLKWYAASTGGTALISGTGGATFTTPTLTTTTTYYVEVLKGTCANPQRYPVTVTVNPLPTATISGTASVCMNTTSPSVTFTGANGKAPYTFTYKLNGGSSQTVTSTGNSATVSVPTNATGSYVYSLVSVKDDNTCSNSASGSSTITVNPLPTASISGGTSVCQNSSQPLVTFTGTNGTAPYTITYKVNGGSTQTIVTSGPTNTATVAAPTTTATTLIYDLVSVTDSNTPQCVQNASGSTSIIINPTPALSSTLTPSSTCSESLFQYTPTSSTSGTTFTWSRALVSGISNPAVTSASGSISETLINTTSSPIVVTYKYTPTAGTCTGSTQNVTVTVNPNATLTTITNQSICLGQSLELTTLNPTVTNGVTGTFSWYDAPGGGTPLSSTLITPAAGTKTYYVRYTTSNGCYAERSFNLTVNDLPTLTISNPAITIPEATASISLQATTNATNIKWYTSTGTLAGTGANITVTPPATAGTYVYTVIVDNGSGTCSSTANVTVSVYSTTVCPPLRQRVYASDASTTSGSVTDISLAADGDPRTASTLTSPISLLGLGAATQNLTWTTTITAGTPVTIKFGPGVNLLGLGSGISVIAFKKTGSIITPIGSSQSMNAALLTLLPGTNMLEYTFVPTNSSGVPQDYDGIKVTLNALLSLGLTANIYEAYYYKTAPSLDCTKDVMDVLSGAEAPLGLGVATATVNVTNPWGVVDNSGTPTVLTNTVGVAAYAKERIIFSSQSLPGDSLKIVTSVPGTILNLGLLGGFSIQRYLGNSPVGALIAGNSSLITLKLLDAGTKAALIVAPMAEPYDAIEIRLGSVVSAFSALNLHQIQRIANTKAIDADVNNYIEVCQGKDVTLPTTACTTFEWYETATGGTPVNTGQTISTVGLTGTKVYYIQPVRYDCRNMPRGVLTIKINPLTITLGTFPSVCQGIGSASLPYSGLACATKYNLTWNAAATTAGFTSVTNATLTNGTIPITIPNPALITPTTYNGFLTLINEAATSAPIAFSVKINPKPSQASIHIQ